MTWIEIFKVIILGIVEGITEWLPISSTGHMILVDEFIQMNNVTEEFKEMFFVVIQLGAIMAVVLKYFTKLNPFAKRKSGREKRNTWVLWYKVIIACLPAAVIGILFDDKIDELFMNYQTVAITLILYGILFLIVENHNRRRQPEITELNELTYKVAFLIGVFQLLSLIPGTSRSGATIIGALLLGTSRYVATEFTFFLAIPVMFGASLLKIVKYIIKVGFAFGTTEILVLILGMVTAFLVSVIVIQFLMAFIKKHNFKPFGYYRIVLGILVLTYFLFFDK